MSHWNEAAPHPDYSRGHREAPEFAPAGVSWWTRPDAQACRATFRALMEAEQTRMAATRESRFVAVKFLDAGVA